MEFPTNGYSYLNGELIFNQIARALQSVQKSLQPGSLGAAELTDQVERLHSRRERWPQKIISDWKNRSMPVFSAESITKLNQNYLSEVERVNDA